MSTAVSSATRGSTSLPAAGPAAVLNSAVLNSAVLNSAVLNSSSAERAPSGSGSWPPIRYSGTPVRWQARLGGGGGTPQTPQRGGPGAQGVLPADQVQRHAGALAGAAGLGGQTAEADKDGRRGVGQVVFELGCHQQRVERQH